MGGGSQSTSSGPPRWMVPYIQDVMNQGKSLYNNYTPQYYPNSTVAPQSDATQAGLANLANYGNTAVNQAAVNASTGSLGTLSGASTTQGNPLLAAGQQTLPGNLSYLSGVQNSSPTGVENLAGATGANTANAINSQLTTAPGSSPYVDELVQRALQANTRNFSQSALPQIDNGSQITGGYGGTRQGVAQGVALQGLADANANTAAQIYSGQYNADLDRQLQAAGLGANVSTAGTNSQLARSAQGLTATGQGLDLLNSGYTTGIDAAKAAGVLAPSTQQVGLGGTQAQLTSGQAQDAYAQSLVQDALNRWNFQQDLPYSQLNQYAGIVNGTGNQAGVVSSTSGGGNAAGGILGGAVAGAGVASAISSGMTAAGSAMSWNPYGWALMAGGALLGYLGSR